MPAATSKTAGQLISWVFVVLVVAVPLVMASWFALCPQYGDPACPTNARPLDVLAAYRAAPPVLMQTFLVVNLAVAYLFPLGYIAMGTASWRGSPWLTALGVVCGWLAAIAWATSRTRTSCSPIWRRPGTIRSSPPWSGRTSAIGTSLRSRSDGWPAIFSDICSWVWLFFERRSFRRGVACWSSPRCL